ncbi:hypothetical protein NECID01_0865 [Nematocida sp. AWRm77]|nr:hypothetical protein NECID01_0865 [Nematocida sp. AWRm77]
MNVLKSFLGCWSFKEKSAVSCVLIGTLSVSVEKRAYSMRISTEFRGHCSVLTVERPKATFDVFKHGSLHVKVGRKAFRVGTQSLSVQVLEYGGCSVRVQYLPGKKKLSEEDFAFLLLIGRGTFGKVVLVQHKRTERMYACKIIKKTKSKDSLEKIVNEKNILTQVHSPFLIHLLASFQTDTSVFLILPYIEGGELFHHLQESKAFSEESAVFYFCELLLAVEYLHKHQIIYRDIKPENILLDREGHVVLCDFGMSTQSPMAVTYCGTPEYIAPEILRNEEYGKAVDCYTLGVLLYEMVCGHPPFSLGEEEDPEDLENRILFSEVFYPESMSPLLRDLLSLLLSKTPEKRPLSEEVKRHPFFAHINWEKVERKEYAPPIVPEEQQREYSNDLLDTEQHTEHQNDTYQGILTEFTYCPDDWE